MQQTISRPAYFIEIFIIFLTHLPLHAKISINKTIPLSFLRYTAELNRISHAVRSLTGILQFFIIPTVIAAAGNSRLPGPVRSVCFQKHNTPKERGEHSFISCSPRSDFFIFGFVLKCHRSAPLMYMDFCCRLGGLLMNSWRRCVILVLLLCLSDA